MVLLGCTFLILSIMVIEGGVVLLGFLMLLSLLMVLLIVCGVGVVF